MQILIRGPKYDIILKCSDEDPKLFLNGSGSAGKKRDPVLSELKKKRRIQIQSNIEI